MIHVSNRHKVRWNKENFNIRTVLVTSLIFFLSIMTGCGGGGDTGGSSISGKSVTLAWDAPTTNTDDTPLVDLAGFRLYYGTSSPSYSDWRDVGNVTTYTVSGLPAGMYHFAVTAYDIAGNESDPSDEVIVNLE